MDPATNLLTLIVRLRSLIKSMKLRSPRSCVWHRSALASSLERLWLLVLGYFLPRGMVG